MRAARHLLAIAVAAMALGACGSRTALELEARDAAIAPRDAAPPPSEACNAIDDDGDGAIDEGIPNVACGLGACRAEVPGCVGGTVPACAPGPPSMESCNAIDDDCDGAVDEDLGFGAVGEPVIVRVETEGGSDRCSTCRIAFAPDAVSTSAGIFVTWRIGFLGSAPDPNVFGRLLDRDASPIGSVELLFGTDSTEGPRSLAAPDGASLVHCARMGSSDVTTSVLLDPRGRFVSEQPRSPTGRSCGAWEPDGVWTGERFLYAWTDNSSGPVAGHEVLLDVADASGRSVGSRELHPEGSSGPRFALGHGRVLMTVEIRPEPRRSQLAVHRLSLAGEALGEPLIFDIPDGVDDAFATPHPVATDDGWLVLAGAASRDPAGRFVIRLAPDGSLVSGPIRIDDGTRYVNGFDDVLARGAGAAIATPTQIDGDYGYAILSIGADGGTRDGWRPNLGAEPGFGRASLLSHEGRVFVTYTVSVDDEHNQVRVRELGCAP